VSRVFEYCADPLESQITQTHELLSVAVDLLGKSLALDCHELLYVLGSDQLPHPLGV
jgi:hypothetical protein